MKKFISLITFGLLLVGIIILRLEVIDVNTSSTAFVFMLLITVLTSLFWGFFAGVIMLIANAVLTAYAFMSPYDLTQLTQTELQELGLFILEGMVILLLVYILQKSKEEEHELRQRFQVILSSIGDAVIATNKHGNITYMNAAAQKLLGLKFHNAHKKKLFSVINIEDKNIHTFFKESVSAAIHEGKQKSVNKPVKITTHRGKKIDIQDTIAPLRDIKGKIIGVVIIFKNVSQQREMELQKEVLLGSISHELKNYITSIQGYSMLIQKKISETNDEKLISFASKLNNKVETMKNMVISMLDLSKLSVGKLDMNPEKFDIEELIQSTINDLAIDTQHIIKMKGAVDVYVEGDKIRIGQVLTNLISNAIKYSSDDKEIHVKVERKDMDVIVSVTDFGSGISEEQIEKIFNPFYRAGNEQEKKQISGSGLGLYISKEIIKQNGGDIWLETKAGKGSTFYFSLPAIITDETEVIEESKSIINKIKRLLKFNLARV